MIYLLLSGLNAGLDWYGVWREDKLLEYIFKPATMITLMLWFATSAGFDQGLLPISFLLGLAFSTGGDIFLMLPDNRFVFGLSAFLLAHFAYIVTFTSQGVVTAPLSGILLLVIAGIAALIFSRLRAGLLASGQQSLIAPVAGYVIVIALMVWAATATNLSAAWGTDARLLCSIGAGFFFTSDAILGWNRFVRAVPNGNLIVIVTYHLAQFLMTGGVILQLGGEIL